MESMEDSEEQNLHRLPNSHLGGSTEGNTSADCWATVASSGSQEGSEGAAAADGWSFWWRRQSIMGSSGEGITLFSS